MLNRKLFKQTFLLLFVVAVLDVIAEALYLFDFVWWFDILLHFLSGVTVAMAWVLFWDFLKPTVGSDKNKIIITAILCALIVGILWEVYEYYFDITAFDEISHGMSYIVDTVKDLVMDMSGGLFGALYGFKIVSEKK